MPRVLTETFATKQGRPLRVLGTILCNVPHGGQQALYGASQVGHRGFYGPKSMVLWIDRKMVMMPDAKRRSLFTLEVALGVDVQFRFNFMTLSMIRRPIDRSENDGLPKIRR